MGLRLKFNLVILATFLVGFCATALLLNWRFDHDAREEALASARIMIEAADAIRNYTSKEVTPVVGHELEGKFVRASVPAFAARAHFAALKSESPEYSYKEAALNPTNLENRTADWEADIVSTFRQPHSPREIISERNTPTGPQLNLARPITVSEESCLACHSQPSAAPASMTALYGTANGFGWHLHEVIGAQIVSLPLSAPLGKAHRTLALFLLLLTGIFAVMMVMLNVLLHYLIIQPVRTISSAATDISLGHVAPELRLKGNDEISMLFSAFNRMRRSVEHAMRMLEEHESLAGAKS
jgi:protein-histidine pros-kinase